MKRLLMIVWIALALAPAATWAKPAKESKVATLDDAVKVLKHNKKSRLRIEVHTDSRGSSSYNRKISQQRAEAIANDLIKRGVKAKRLDPKGYGEDRPIADNKTAAGRAKNRRIELVIVDP